MTATIPAQAPGTTASGAPVDIDHYITGHVDARSAANGWPNDTQVRADFSMPTHE